MRLWQRLRRMSHRAPSVSAGTTSAASPGRWLGQVEQLLREGQQGRALELLGRLTTAHPEDPEPLLRLAELLSARREHAAAMPVLQRLLALTRGEARLRIHDLLSQAHQALGEHQQALRHLEAILCDDLDYPQARARHALLLGTTASPLGVEAPRQGTGSVDALPTLAGPADVQHGRYRLMRELGRGSAGTVYLALDTDLDREVAIKIFHPRPQRTEGMRAWNEARIMAAVRHPGVVAIYDLDDERNLIVMELCRGGTLRQRLSAGRLPPAVALSRMQELLAALAVVHRAGVVHGDLKPGNVLFRGTQGGEGEKWYGDLVLADFGVARLLGEQDPQDGTLGYLAPERRQTKGRLLPASDMYAAGAIFLEMLQGTLALNREELLRGEPLRPVLHGEVAAELGPWRSAVEAVLAHLLEPDATRRPDAMTALRSVQQLGALPG
ncbi:MAG: protein kinase [Myxococcales bacterium]|nr:protein kinase [Myxococcales bacterium]